MQGSRWEKMHETIGRKFGIDKELSEILELQGGIKGRRESILFSTPKGKMKLERVIKPKVDEIKYHYSRRTSRGAHQSVRFSATETVELIKLYLFVPAAGEWKEIEFQNI